MPTEPSTKRLITFIDGQALFHASKDAFGYIYPNYDVQKLSQEIAKLNGWSLVETYFYTGVPGIAESTFWHDFWAAKLAVMGTRGIHIFTRPLRYVSGSVRMKDGSTQTVRIGREKGIDIRIALDVVRLALEDCYDVGLVFSQDQDLSEVADEVRMISKRHRRWIKIASAYPISSTYLNDRGIYNTQWVRIDRPLYDSCIDLIDYRPKPRVNPVLP